jgi:cell wall-associated NlpC family hydrolase
MKISGLLLLCLIISTSGFSQNRKEAKLYTLLGEENFVKLEKKASKILKKDKSNFYANTALTHYYLNKYAISKSTASKKGAISNALRRWKYVQNLPTTNLELQTALHQILLENAQDSVIKPSINKKYRNWLLVYFDEQVPDFQKTETVIIHTVDSNKVRDSLRYAMLLSAQKLEGVKYTYAGTSPSKGFDCSGFTQYVYKQVGIEIPHNAQMQSDLESQQTPLKDLKPGDLVFFGHWNGSKQKTVHTGIIFDKNGDDITVIHCVSGGVSIEGKDSSWDRYWIDRVLFGISMNTLAKK